MIRPDTAPRFEGESFSSDGELATNGGAPSQNESDLGNVVEDVLINVIRGIFGQGN